TTSTKGLLVEENVYFEKIDGEKIIYTGLLPNEENVSYILSVEIMKDNQVEDTRISFIYVPAKEMNASLSTDKTVYDKSNTSATLKLENYGPTFLTFGKAYTVEKKVNDKWRIVPLD